MASIFTRIINGEIPCYKVAENETCYAFLDISPLTIGHTLVVPKKEIDQLFDLDDRSYRELMQFAKQVGVAIKKAVPCKRVGLAVIGLEVPHAHVHLIPMNIMADLDFSRPKLKLDSTEMIAVSNRISEAFASL